MKIYRMKDFLRLTETGEIDVDRSKEIVRQLAVAAAFHADHNILLDLRETTIKEENMSDVLEDLRRFALERRALFPRIDFLAEAKARSRDSNPMGLPQGERSRPCLVS